MARGGGGGTALLGSVARSLVSPRVSQAWATQPHSLVATRTLNYLLGLADGRGCRTLRLPADWPRHAQHHPASSLPRPSLPSPHHHGVPGVAGVRRGTSAGGRGAERGEQYWECEAERGVASAGGSHVCGRQVWAGPGVGGVPDKRVLWQGSCLAKDEQHWCR
ncbi:hypothetical protein E2C01_064527 [Portunus trituberculatus]|uniref:Uncharacterized protein n=1 Tax=Portunus trituberculatus TaxID=210409 RepID=A0A5B7HJC7_PORTR|nr:hypothetical protein [Portunus trituberculatus]